MAKLQSTEAQIATFKAQLWNDCYPEKGDVMKEEGETHRKAEWGRNSGPPGLLHQAAPGKCNKPG